MTLPRYQSTATRAHELRRRATPAEDALWQLLRNRRLGDLKFRRQVPCGPYILDFYCAQKQLAIEVDGPAHSQPDAAAYDHERSRYLDALGMQVMRVPNADVLARPSDVLIRIEERARALPHPGPLPEGEGATTPAVETNSSSCPAPLSHRERGRG